MVLGSNHKRATYRRVTNGRQRTHRSSNSRVPGTRKPQNQPAIPRQSAQAARGSRDHRRPVARRNHRTARVPRRTSSPLAAVLGHRRSFRSRSGMGTDTTQSPLPLLGSTLCNMWQALRPGNVSKRTQSASIRCRIRTNFGGNRTAELTD